MNVSLTWDFAIHFEPIEGFCDDFNGVMNWIIRDPATGRGIGDLVASRCNARLSWTARYITDNPVKVEAVGLVESVADWNLYWGATAALEKIGMTLQGTVPIGKIKRYHPSKGDVGGSVYDLE